MLRIHVSNISGLLERPKVIYFFIVLLIIVLIMDQYVHIGYEAGVTAHLLDTDGEKIGTGFLDSGAAVSLMGKQGEKTWKKWASPGGPYTDELKISSRQARSDLRSLENSNNSSPLGKTEPLGESPCSGEPGRFESVHFGTRFRQEL